MTRGKNREKHVWLMAMLVEIGLSPNSWVASSSMHYVYRVFGAVQEVGRFVLVFLRVVLSHSLAHKANQIPSSPATGQQQSLESANGDICKDDVLLMHP